MNPLPHHEFRWALLFMGFALVFSVGALSFMGKKIVHELQQKSLEVNSLMHEVGELKSENLWLYRQYSDSVEVLESIGGSLETLEDQVDEASDRKTSQALQSLIVAEQHRDVSSSSVILQNDTTLDILILGTHGRLTDTIMLASVNPVLKTVTLISLPRDLVVNGRRINEYYMKYGIDPLRKEIQTITGHYPEKYVVVDLKGFETLIDRLGGIDVTVEKAIYDPSYPGPNGSYQLFSLETGPQHLDGKTALQFARSRKSSSDFERAKRQQQVIEAVRAKATALELSKHLDDLAGLYAALQDSIKTDVGLLDILSYADEYASYTVERGNVLTSSNYLYSTISPEGAYLLMPKDPSYAAIRGYVEKLVEE